MPLLRGTKLVLVALCVLAVARTPADERAAARLYEQLRAGPELEAFLRAFPKGGDLHTHLDGAVPPEKLIDIAARHSFCLDPEALLLIQNPTGPCPAGQVSASTLRPGSEVYQRLLDRMSMRGNLGGPEKGHDHFFQAFRVRVLVRGAVMGDYLEEVILRAAAQNISYLEVMLFPFNIRDTAKLTALLHVEASLAEWLEIVEKSDALQSFVGEGLRTIARGEAELLARRPVEAAEVQRRYIVNIGRTREPATVFSHLVAAAALAKAEPRVVGVNLVGVEDHPVARRDFRLHMRMLDFLVSRRPYLRVALHAGELTPRLLGAADDRRGPAPAGSVSEDLTFHIGESVWQGRAARIGHGSSLPYEKFQNDLLEAMRERGILAEMCLTSEAVILGLSARENAFLAFREAGVPISLNTDDEGILETDLSREFLRAARDYGLSYQDLKWLARNSLEFSFLPGQSLFRNRRYQAWVPACSAPIEGEGMTWSAFRKRLSPECRAFLESNPKAEAQLNLEHRFLQFESAPSLARFPRKPE